MTRLIQECVARYGSPLYLYDLAVVAQRARELQSMLPTGAKLLYSIKANPHPAIARALAALKCGMEISSVGELAVASQSGAPISQWLYTGPGKTEQEIAAALEAGVRRFSAESWTDLDRTQTQARRKRLDVELLLRVNPENACRSQLKMGGAATQFGFSEKELCEEAGRVREAGRHVRIAGVHVYAGSQIRAQGALEDAVKSAVEAAERISEATRMRWSVVDVGGGFAWPYADAAKQPDMDGTGAQLRDACVPLMEAGIEIWFESGRYLTASCGELVATVMDIKRSGGRTFVVLDSGINHLGGMGALGRIQRASVSVTPVVDESAASGETVRVDVVGPLCTPLDCLVRDAVLPPLAPGQLVRIPNVGAYGLSASLVGFLGRPLPVEVVHQEACVLETSRLELSRSTHRTSIAPGRVAQSCEV